MQDKSTLKYVMYNLSKNNWVFFLFFLFVGVACSSEYKGSRTTSSHTQTASEQLKVTAIGKEYNPVDAEVAVYQQAFSNGGNTSVRNVDKANLKWKGQGYFQRNRDLGQVFTPEKDFFLKAIVLRTGPGDAAVLFNTPGAKVFLQLFEVTGEPKINDNKSPFGAESKHGFTQSHRGDDYIEGVEYKSIAIAKGGVFPEIPATNKDGEPLDRDLGKLQYMRWELMGSLILKFEAGKRYAFLVGFEEPAQGLGFTLANYNAASSTDSSSLNGNAVGYNGGWSIRREGDGTLPPTLFEGENPPKQMDLINLANKESLFATGDARYALEPTTDGYPDVDTYRDLEFALEVHWENPHE